MASPECVELRLDLEAFVDGEQTGVDRLRVIEHIQSCRECAAEVRALEEVGRLIRTRATVAAPGAGDLDGLADSVVSRMTAESALSWRRVLARASEDWHWAFVGAGAMAAAFLTTVFAAVLLAFGPAPQQENSLAAMMTNRSSSAGVLIVYASTPGERGDPVVLRIDDGRPSRSRTIEAFPFDARYWSSEADLVDALMAATVTHDGRVVELAQMQPADRLATERIFDRLSRRTARSPVRTGSVVEVREVRLFTSASVSAKGL